MISTLRDFSVIEGVTKKNTGFCIIEEALHKKQKIVGGGSVAPFEGASHVAGVGAKSADSLMLT